MCGITGVIAFNGSHAPTAELLLAMCDALHHRGPDDCGYTLQDNVGLGMRRLSIIDVTGGHQPISNEDRSVRVVCNGEIYNYRELRSELKAKGHHFRTQTDTEVLVHLWEEHGTGMLDKLDGMFAFALHDIAAKRVFLARDHIGIKPLFYAQTEQHFVFGSEPKSLLASGVVSRELNVDALAQFMAWEYVPGEQTLHRSIRKLEAGCMIDIDLASHRTNIRRYWDIDTANGSGDVHKGNRMSRDHMEMWCSTIDSTIQRNVRRQLVSDVPLGAFLSGGVDSSLVVAAMGAEAHAFSIGFNNRSYNELPWAQQVAKHVGAKHEYEIVEPQAVEMFEHLMHFMDDPIGDFSIFPTYLISRHAKQHVKVALSGDGGDELFGGYETYIAEERSRTWMRLPALVRKRMLEPLLRVCPPTAKKKGIINKAKRFVEGLENGEHLGHARWRVFVGELLRASLFTPEALKAIETPVGAHIEQLNKRYTGRNDCTRSLYVDFKSYLVDNCLVKTDRMSMATSLEVRVPLLAREVVELAFAMPAALKVSGGQTKVLLKRVAARHVPRECVYRPKEGFSVPVKHWLNTVLKPLVEEHLSPAALEADGIFDPQTVQRLISEHANHRANHSHVLWSLLVFQDWKARWAT